MSHPSQPHIVVDETAGRYEAPLSPKERNEMLRPTRGIFFALELALVATACWYLGWFLFPTRVPAWAGLVVFCSAYVAGYGLAQMRLRHLVVNLERRRSALLKFAHEYKKQREPNQTKGE